MRPKLLQNATRIDLLIEGETHEALIRLAKKWHCSRSEVVRQLIAEADRASELLQAKTGRGHVFHIAQDIKSVGVHKAKRTKPRRKSSG